MILWSRTRHVGGRPDVAFDLSDITRKGWPMGGTTEVVPFPSRMMVGISIERARADSSLRSE